MTVLTFYPTCCFLMPLMSMSRSKATHQRCYYEYVFWKYEANSQENSYAEVWLQYSGKATLLKSHFGRGVNCKFAAYLRGPFYKNTSESLLLLLNNLVARSCDTHESFFACLYLTWRFLNLDLLIAEATHQSVLKKRCSENMQEIYRRTPVSKWVFSGMGVLL